jgi:hypothetical protein
VQNQANTLDVIRIANQNQASSETNAYELMWAGAVIIYRLYLGILYRNKKQNNEKKSNDIQNHMITIEPVGRQTFLLTFST